MTVLSAALPPESQLNRYYREGDYMDCFCASNARSDMAPLVAAQRLVASLPVWAKLLTGLRNRLVAPFGLKGAPATEEHPAPAPDRQPAVGERVGFFRIYAISDREVILGEDDRHLDFRISVFQGPNGLTMATWVGPHHIWGRLYLAMVLPFHRLIMHQILARLAA